MYLFRDLNETPLLKDNMELVAHTYPFLGYRNAGCNVTSDEVSYATLSTVPGMKIPTFTVTVIIRGSSYDEVFIEATNYCTEIYALSEFDMATEWFPTSGVRCFYISATDFKITEHSARFEATAEFTMNFQCVKYNAIDTDVVDMSFNGGEGGEGGTPLDDENEWEDILNLKDEGPATYTLSKKYERLSVVATWDVENFDREGISMHTFWDNYEYIRDGISVVDWYNITNEGIDMTPEGLEGKDYQNIRTAYSLIEVDREVTVRIELRRNGQVIPLSDLPKFDWKLSGKVKKIGGLNA